MYIVRDDERLMDLVLIELSDSQLISVERGTEHDYKFRAMWYIYKNLYTGCLTVVRNYECDPLLHT